MSIRARTCGTASRSTAPILSLTRWAVNGTSRSRTPVASAAALASSRAARALGRLAGAQDGLAGRGPHAPRCGSCRRRTLKAAEVPEVYVDRRVAGAEDNGGCRHFVSAPFIMTADPPSTCCRRSLQQSGEPAQGRRKSRWLSKRGLGEPRACGLIGLARLSLS